MERNQLLDLLRHGHSGTDISGLRDIAQEASVEVCELLDHLGYSEAIVRYRRGKYKDFDTQMNRLMTFTLTTTGSKEEGQAVFTRPRHMYTTRRCLPDNT
ncbi:uncharacterized protein LOC128224633 [Mya arenaria]|uniref:uncharacterized protein LOC128224633 n=1 Tax=Mya arenaria TaxID=6604 RepID=UPI0022E3DD95|nr:uncharacterized protein LOC128224633 [Mya arenaria]